MPEIPDYERKAVEETWVHEGHPSATFDDIPVEEREGLLRQVRNREEQIEHHVLHDMLDRTLSEGRRSPRRHQLVAIVVIAAIFAAALIIGLILQVFQSILRFI